MRTRACLSLGAGLRRCRRIRRGLRGCRLSCFRRRRRFRRRFRRHPAPLRLDQPCLLRKLRLQQPRKRGLPTSELLTSTPLHRRCVRCSSKLRRVLRIRTRQLGQRISLAAA